MNPATVLGIAGALGLIAGVAFFSTAQPSLLWNATGFAIVIGGTFAATLVSFPFGQVVHSFRVFLIVLMNERLYAKTDLEELSRVTKAAMNATVLETEKAIKTMANPFLRLGMQLVLDGTSAADISNILGYRIERLKTREQAEANVFRAMSSYAPAMGLVGTLLSLSNMFADIGAPIDVIGSNMALALMSTMYGLIASNVLLRPVALKLEHRTLQRVEVMNLVLEGVLLVQQRRSPTAVRETMATLAEENPDEIGVGRKRPLPGAVR